MTKISVSHYKYLLFIIFLCTVINFTFISTQEFNGIENTTIGFAALLTSTSEEPEIDPETNYSTLISLSQTTDNSTNPNQITQTPKLEETTPPDNHEINRIFDGVLSKPIPMDYEPFAPVQKCCPIGQVLRLGPPGGRTICEDSEEYFAIDIYYANTTHYWRNKTSDQKDVTIISRDPCYLKGLSKYYLDPHETVNDTFRLLHNSSLYIPNDMTMLSVDEYCLDAIILTKGVLVTALICTYTPDTAVFHYFYGACVLTSVICLILFAMYPVKHLSIKEEHKTCFRFFAGTMGIAYFFVALTVFLNKVLNFYLSVVLAYFIYYFKFTYYLWLNLLCYDTYKCVSSRNESRSYLKIYATIAFGIPILFVIVSFFDHFRPPLPNLYMNTEFSSSINWVIVLFLLPIGASTVGNIIGLFMTSLPQGRYRTAKELIETLKAKDWKPPPANIIEINNMYKRTLFLSVIIFVCFSFDCVMFILHSSGSSQIHFMLRDMFYSLQGLFVLVIFIPKNYFQKLCCKTPPVPTPETEMININHEK